MMVFKSALVGVIVATLGVGVIHADESSDGEKLTRAEKRMAKFKKKYRTTDVVKNCISLRSIDHTKILDDKTILFEMKGRKAYLNEMSRRCPRLAREESFMYKTSTSQLCNVDMITVIDSFGRDWASCGLGKFRVLEKIKSDDAKETPDAKSEK